MKIAAVILAGGQGSRIGGHKPHRMLGGASLLDRALTYADCHSTPVAVVVREAGQVRHVEVPIIQDDAAIEGPLGGLVSGLRFARDEGTGALLTIPVDMPFLPPDLADRFSQVLSRSGVAIACSGGRLHPVCGLWSIAALESVAEYVASGRRSLRGFAAEVGYIPVEWPVDPLDPFFNINSEQDLAQAEQLLGA